MVVRLDLNFNDIDDLAGKLRLAACSSDSSVFRISDKNAILLARRIEDGRTASDRPELRYVVVNTGLLELRRGQWWLAIMLTLLSVSAFNDAAKFIAGLL